MPFYFSRKQKEEPKEDDHPTLRVELQTIRLNPDSQRLVLDTLRFIHGPDYKLSGSSGYKVESYCLQISKAQNYCLL